MTRISSRLSSLLRVGPWIVYAAAALWLLFNLPDASDIGSIIKNWWWFITVFSFGSAFHYFTHWQLLDEVVDRGEQLTLRRGRVEIDVSLAKISAIREGLPVFGNLNGRKEVIMELTQRTELGRRIHFAPTSTSRLPHAHRRVGLVNHLRLRAERARANAA
jgi:hypothetical protein